MYFGPIVSHLYSWMNRKMQGRAKLILATHEHTYTIDTTIIFNIWGFNTIFCPWYSNCVCAINDLRPTWGPQNISDIVQGIILLVEAAGILEQCLTL